MNTSQALIVIDVQNEYFTGALPVTYPENSFDHIKEAIIAAHNSNIPVIFIKHLCNTPDATTFKGGTFEQELHPDLLALGADITFTKEFPSSFYKTGLQDYLIQHNIDTLTVVGYMTQMCCDTTARQAAHMGYQVNFLSDATGTLAFSNAQGSITAKQLHESVLITQAGFFSNVIPTSEWLQQLV